MYYMDNVLQYRGNIGNYKRYFYFNRDTGYGEWYAKKKQTELHPYSYEDIVTPNTMGVFRISYSQALGESPIEDDIGILESINNAYNFGKYIIYWDSGNYYIKDGSGIKSPISFDTSNDAEHWILDQYSVDEDLSIEDDPESSYQKISSSATSINSSKLPAIFSLVKFEPKSINLDYGGGKFDNAAEFLQDEYGATNLVYDKYNRSAEHNSNVLREVRKNGGADTVTLSNVLNVIAEKEERLAVLRNCKRFVKPGGKVYITVYEGVKGKGPSETKFGYQLNRQTKDYEDELKEVFNSVTRKGKLFTCS